MGFILMGATTTSAQPSQFAQQLIDGMGESARNACRMIWDAAKAQMLEHWFLILVCLAGILALAIAQFRMTKRWAFLGSVLYNYAYATVLLILILVFGPEIFANPWIDLILFAVYVACYALVGMFLRASGIQVRGRRRRDVF